ncbi:MAG: preprotein translocase subunit SecE [Parcubacteria group bacterium]|nr:preprotein translocase subunit SecE [Parcubacteria group bacterium]
MAKIINYLKETKMEMRHVSWPTKKQVTYFTILIIVISLLTAAFLGLFDVALTWLLETLVL